MSLSNHFHIPSLSISIAVNGFIFCLSFLINIIPLWCDKMPQMNRATLICISFYFHSANCDDSTVSFIIKFNCGEKRYIDTVCCCLASAFICVCVYMCTLLFFFFFFWQITLIVPAIIGTMSKLLQITNSQHLTLHYYIHTCIYKAFIYLLTYSFVFCFYG